MLLSFNSNQFLFFVVLFSLVVIPHGIFPVSVVYTFLLLLFIRVRKPKLAYVDFFFIISIWLVAIISASFSIITSSFIFTVFYISFMQLRFDDCNGSDFFYFKIIVYLFVFSYFLQMIYSMATGGFIDDEGNSRLSLTIGDPNFSGFLVFLVVTIMYFSRWIKTSILLSVLNVFFIESRAFLISVIVFFVFELFFSRRRISAFSFIAIQFFGFAFIVLFIVNWELYLDYIQSLVNEMFFNDIESIRLLNFYDRSNIGRFGSFEYFINKMFSDLNFLLNGVGSEKALFNYNSVLPHNSMIYFFSVYGAPYVLVFFVALYRLFNVVSENKISLSLTCGFTFYTMFLHGAYSYIFLSLMLISIVFANKINDSN